MRKIWSEERKFEIWLQIEVLACEAMAELGEIPKGTLRKFGSERGSPFLKSWRSKNGQITT